MTELSAGHGNLDTPRRRSPVLSLVVVVGVLLTSGWMSCAGEPAVPEPRLLVAHKLNVTYFGRSLVDPPPAALVDLFAGCYELEFEPGAGRAGWPERFRFELTRSPGSFPGTLRVNSSFGNSNRPDWFCLDAFTAIVDWPPSHDPWIELLIRLEPSGYSLRTNQNSAKVSSLKRISCGDSRSDAEERRGTPPAANNASPICPGSSGPT